MRWGPGRGRGGAACGWQGLARAQTLSPCAPSPRAWPAAHCCSLGPCSSISTAGPLPGLRGAGGPGGHHHTLRARIVFLSGRKWAAGGGREAQRRGQGQRVGVCKRPTLIPTAHKRLPASRDAKVTEVNFRAISRKEISGGDLGPLEGHGQPRADTGGPALQRSVPPMGSPFSSIKTWVSFHLVFL